MTNRVTQERRLSMNKNLKAMRNAAGTMKVAPAARSSHEKVAQSLKLDANAKEAAPSCYHIGHSTSGDYSGIFGDIFVSSTPTGHVGHSTSGDYSAIIGHITVNILSEETFLKINNLNVLEAIGNILPFLNKTEKINKTGNDVI